MTAASLVSLQWGIWWVALSCTLAAVLTLIGALHGSPEHRVPRMILGVAVAAIACSYWWDVFAGVPQTGAELRRGAGFALWPALAWTAYSGMTYARRVGVAAKRLGIGADDE